MSICNRASEEAHRAWAAAGAEISRDDAKPEDLDRLQQVWKETCERISQRSAELIETSSRHKRLHQRLRSADKEEVEKKEAARMEEQSEQLKQASADERKAQA
eukprot:2183355-Heterocapsa_arctica.AAC.1